MIHQKIVSHLQVFINSFDVRVVQSSLIDQEIENCPKKDRKGERRRRMSCESEYLNSKNLIYLLKGKLQQNFITDKGK